MNMERLNTAINTAPTPWAASQKTVKIHDRAMRLLRLFTISIGLCWLCSGCTSWYLLTTPPGAPVDHKLGYRTLGSKIEDVNIEAKIKANLYKAHRDYRHANITITSYNSIVLLTGTVKDKTMKSLATKIAQDTRKVRQVHNKLDINKTANPRQKASDNWLGFKIKSKLVASRQVPHDKIKVITTNNVAYLMGLLTQIEATRAVQAINQITGLKKIVKVIEYVTPLSPYALEAKTSKPL